MRKIIQKISFVSVVPLFLGYSAFAFTNMVCENEDKTVKSTFYSDAPFGFILRSMLTYRNVQATYSLLRDGGDLDHTKNYLAFVTFPKGQSLIISSNMETAVAFDENGLFLSALKCDFAKE